MSKHLILSLLLLFSLSLSLSYADVFIPQNDTHIQYVGRTVEMNISRYAGKNVTLGRVFDWSGVTVAATITKTSKLSVWMAITQESLSIFTFLLDGQVHSKFNVTVGFTSTEIVLDTNIDSGTHNIALVRLQEAGAGASVFYGFGLSDGGSLVTPPPRPDRRIEFIGDSITCGYGNAGPPGCSGNIPTYEDAYYAHGEVTARLLQADYHIVAWSGKEMIHNNGDVNASSALPMPAYFNKTLGNTYPSPIWNFNNWVPQVVFINLGTNDFSGSVQPTAAQFIDAYVAFVNHVATVYEPTPKFFFACGVMSAAYCGYIQNVSNVIAGSYVINLFNDKVNYSIHGCDGHPSIYTDEYMGEAQANHISAVMGWAVTPTTITTTTTTTTVSSTTTTSKATTTSTASTSQSTTSQSTTSQSTTSQTTTPSTTSSTANSSSTTSPSNSTTTTSSPITPSSTAAITSVSISFISLLFIICI